MTNLGDAGKFWYVKHIEKCCGDERPTWARQANDTKPGEDKEVGEAVGALEAKMAFIFVHCDLSHARIFLCQYVGLGL